MPTETFTTHENFNSRCEGGYGTGCTYAETNPTVFNYPGYSRTYNAVQRRVKPDPLTPTALAKQSTTKRRPSRTGWVLYSVSASCPKARRRQAKAVFSLSEAAYGTTPESDWVVPILNKVQDSIVNLGSALAEFRATGNQLVGYAEGLYTAYNLVRGRAPRHKQITLCDIAGADTGFAFAVKPLAEDLFSAYEALQLRLQEDVMFTFEKSVLSKAVIPFTMTNWENTTKYDYKTDAVKIRCGLKPQLGAITYGNPALWAWELIPFSWLFDYGINVGAYLMQLDALRHIKYVNGTRTRRTMNKFVGRYRYTTPISSGLGNWGFQVTKSHQRFLVTSLPAPPLPKWNPSETFNKVRRVTAVLVSVVNGRRASEIESNPLKHYKLRPCVEARKRVRKHYYPVPSS